MKNKILLNIILFFSIFALSYAYFVEYVLGYKPCNLCLFERLPYFITIIIILIGTLVKTAVDNSASVIWKPPSPTMDITISFGLPSGISWPMLYII